MATEGFSPSARAWFEATFRTPTAAQKRGWPAISAGEHTLISAPTGSGKTLAAFMWAIDRMTTAAVPDKKSRCRVLYVSPLRALAVDVEKNLRAPILGITLAAERLGLDIHEPSVAIRTGDTSAKERRTLVREPPDILITTPESLYLMLTSGARERLRSVDTVIVDEIHAVAHSKRGTHLMLSLERLEEIVARPLQRIGLSATQRPLEEIARFLGGRTKDGPRPVTIVDAGASKPMEVEVVVPVEDMAALDDIQDAPSGAPSDRPEQGTGYGTRRSIWPAIHPKLLELVLAHRSTIVFVNARRLAERLAARLNELAETDIARAHHGSLAREQRLVIEDDLKSGKLRCLVATSSLELGIDMGAVDLVIQVESPGSVSRGLQRIGRAGHKVGEPSRGKIFPKYRGDLLETAVVTKRMREGLIEATTYPRNPLDVLAQQIVAMCAVEDWKVDELATVVRRAAPYTELTDDVLFAVLDLLSGRYPSTEFSELRPRLVWDRRANVLHARDGAKRLAVTSGGTIPDRGLFGVFLPDGRRVGELDEEMVYESRPGETFVLGASTWRIEEITHDRVVVTPAPGEPAKMPFWKGEGPGRPIELGRAVGATIREIRSLDDATALERLRSDYALDDYAASNLLAYLGEQVEAAGAVPDDRTIVIERFRDEIGDWRVCVLTPFGARVHAPWAMALQARLSDRFGSDLQILWSDDGIILRLGEAFDLGSSGASPSNGFPTDELCPSPEDVEALLTSELPNTALFASHFREAAARALLLPRRRPDRRTPLWQQRQRSADLLQVASRYPTFPILLETTRECVRDVFDLPALKEVLRDVRSRKIRVASVETKHASPFAQSLLFGWIAIYMYEGDTPPAERRAAALALDQDLLRELLGTEELRELIDGDALESIELDLQCLSEGRRARNAEELHDMLQRIGELTAAEIDARCSGDPSAWIETLLEQRRAMRVSVAGDERIAAAEDAARLRDALGIALPAGLPAAFTEPVADPLTDLVARYARTHGPFLAQHVVSRLRAPLERIRLSLDRLVTGDRIVRGEFRPEGTEREWCDTEVLRRLRRRSLARLRKEVEAVERSVFARFLPAWQGVTSPRQGPDALAETIGQLQGAQIPASVLETDVLPSRLAAYRPADLDALCASGDVVWVGTGSLGPADGKVALVFRDQFAAIAPQPSGEPPRGPTHEAIRKHLAAAGASFWPDLVGATGNLDERSVLAALWDLVWAGEVTNDTLAPVRSLAWGRPRKDPRGKPRPGNLRRVGPATAAGRWSLVACERTSPTLAAHAQALQLLDRHGVVTREAALAEGVEGGFASVYVVLKALEESGRVRRGYFIEGLGAAQFALPGALERLRDLRDPPADPGSIVLAATDPAQPYGAALPWPESAGKPSRSAGAYVVLVAGACAAYLEKGGRSLISFGVDGDWASALASLQKESRIRRLTIERIDGSPAAESDEADRLRAAGFTDSYKGLVLRG